MGLCFLPVYRLLNMNSNEMSTSTSFMIIPSRPAPYSTEPVGRPTSTYSGLHIPSIRTLQPAATVVYAEVTRLNSAGAGVQAQGAAAKEARMRLTCRAAPRFGRAKPRLTWAGKVGLCCDAGGDQTATLHATCPPHPAALHRPSTLSAPMQAAHAPGPPT